MVLQSSRIKYSVKNNEEINKKFVLQSLTDILEKTDDLEMHIISKFKTYDDFIQTAMNYRVVERCFDIISEATKRIKRVNAKIDIKNNRELILLMNKNYYEITPLAVWEITQRDIHTLKVEVQEIICSLMN